MERIRDWRSRVIADARFQRWAASSPLTRRLAQRKARAAKANEAATELARSNQLLRDELDRKVPR